METIEMWRKVWREGVQKAISTEGLKALRQALIEDDQRLLQGDTTRPLSLYSLRERPVEGACAIGYCGWKTEGLETVGQVEDFFNRQIFLIDTYLVEPKASRWFLNWFDNTPRDEMRRMLLTEVNKALAVRGG